MMKQVEQALKALEGKEVEDGNFSSGSASSLFNGDPAEESSGGSQFWRDDPWTPMHPSYQGSGQATTEGAAIPSGPSLLRHSMTYGADLGEENTPSLTYPLTTYESPEISISTNPATHILSAPTLCLPGAFGGPPLVVMSGPPPSAPDDEWVCPNCRAKNPVARTRCYRCEDSKYGASAESIEVTTTVEATSTPATKSTVLPIRTSSGSDVQDGQPPVPQPSTSTKSKVEEAERQFTGEFSEDGTSGDRAAPAEVDEKASTKMTSVD